MRNFDAKQPFMFWSDFSLQQLLIELNNNIFRSRSISGFLSGFTKTSIIVMKATKTHKSDHTISAFMKQFISYNCIIVIG